MPTFKRESIRLSFKAQDFRNYVNH